MKSAHKTWFSNTAIIVLFVVLAMLLGCKSGGQQPDYEGNATSATIGTAFDNQKQATDKIREDVKTADEATDEIQKQAASTKKQVQILQVTPGTENFRSALDSISTGIDAIVELSAKVHDSLISQQNELNRLQSSSVVIETQIKKVVALEAKIQSLQSEVEKTRTEALGKIYNDIRFAFAIGFAMMVLGGIVCIYNRNIGLIILAIGFLSTGFAAAAIFYLKWVATIGVVVIISGFLLTIGLIAYIVLQAKKKETVLTTAAKENVELVDNIKKDLPVEKKELYFGTADKPGLAQAFQSESTIQLVNNLRGKVTSSPQLSQSEKISNPNSEKLD